MTDQSDLVIYFLIKGMVLFETIKLGLKLTIMHKHIENNGIKYAHESNALLLG